MILTFLFNLFCPMFLFTAENAGSEARAAQLI